MLKIYVDCNCSDGVIFTVIDVAIYDLLLFTGLFLVSLDVVLVPSMLDGIMVHVVVINHTYGIKHRKHNAIKTDSSCRCNFFTAIDYIIFS